MNLKVCKVCKKYSLKEECCSQKTVSPHPPKFSLHDKFGKYRRIVKNKNTSLDNNHR